jgi:signal transduction histidine kinase
VDEARVGIVSDDSEFIEAIVQSWQRSYGAPKFTVAASANNGAPLHTAVVLTDGLDTLAHLSPGAVLAIAIISDEAAVAGEAPSTDREANRPVRVVRIPRRAGWADEAAALAHETVLRLESQAQLAEMKQRLREAERFAALGKFFAESRHGLGNALTGVLGNSELLLLEGEQELHAQARQKVEMIRQMSLKIHDTFHQLSSMDLELRRHAEQDSPLQ